MTTDERQVRTFCRICEPACGLVATVEGGVLVKLSPDREHPISKGYSCHKGLAAVDINRDPDRLNHPMLRTGDKWSTTTWDEAIGHTAARLNSVIDSYGPNAVASYVGNPTAYNSLSTVHTAVLLHSLGVKRQFASRMQDCANKLVASEAVFGTSNVHPIPDLEHTDFCLIIGENLRASQGSFVSLPNVLGELRHATARGARFVFVNPRRIETPDKGIGDTVLIRPDTDVWFLAALLNEIDVLEGFDFHVVAEHGRNIDGLRRFIAQYPAERVAPITGIDAETIREIAAAWVATPRSSVHASTGLNMGRQGTLAYWLVQMLSFVTGRLDIEGGNLKSDGFYPNARSGAGVPEQGYTDTEFGRLRRGSLPGTIMTHSILDSADPIRAMIVVAGNPLLSIAGQDRLREAFEHLEFLLVIDIYPSATSEFADVVLPSTDMYERDDINIINLGTSPRPYVQYTPAVVAPAADRRPEWWIAHRLLQEMNLKSIVDDETPDPWSKWRHMLKTGSGLDLDDLQATGLVAQLPIPVPGTFYSQQVQTADGRIDCCPSSFADALLRCETLFDEEISSSKTGTGRLRLIHRRDVWMHNSWYANVPRMKRGGRTNNPLGMNPSDATERGLSTGSRVKVASDYGAVEAIVELDEAMMPGVVSMVHGWGHTASPRLRVAHESPGTNPNVLLPIGKNSFEPLSSQAHMTGIAVDVTKVADDAGEVEP